MHASGSRRSGAHVLPHQPGVLVLKDMAVIQERATARGSLIEKDKKFCLVLHKYCVFPASKVRTAMAAVCAQAIWTARAAPISFFGAAASIIARAA